MSAPLSVLILDDDAEFAALVGDLVEGRQHSACLVHDLKAAWRQLATSPPDIFLADHYIGRRPSALLARGVVSRILRKPFSSGELFAVVEGSPTYRSRRSSGPR